MAKADASAGAERAGHLHRALEQVGRFALCDYEGADEVLAAETPPVAQAQILVAFKAELLCSLGRRDEARRVFEQALALSTDPAATEKVRRAMQRLDP